MIHSFFSRIYLLSEEVSSHISFAVSPNRWVISVGFMITVLSLCFIYLASEHAFLTVYLEYRGQQARLPFRNR